MNPSEHDNGIVPARGESSPQRGENPAYPADEFAAMDDALFAQVSRLIKESHACVSATVNAEMTELYWQVGNAINENVIDGDRQAYGSRTLEQLAARLTSSYGRGWSVHHLRQCMKLATVFPDEEILYAVRTELSWTSIQHRRPTHLVRERKKTCDVQRPSNVQCQRTESEANVIRPIMQKRFFLKQPSELATAADVTVARDLVDTLEAHRATCAGMAANMIGERKRIIAVVDDGGSLVTRIPLGRFAATLTLARAMMAFSISWLSNPGSYPEMGSRRPQPGCEVRRQHRDGRGLNWKPEKGAYALARHVQTVHGRSAGMLSRRIRGKCLSVASSSRLSASALAAS